jgi:hypothetical protein
MRMWMVEPRKMCRKHLMGEHVEIHMLIGSMRRGYSIQGYIDNNLLEISSISKRHNDLVTEMTKRGYNHKSDLDEIEVKELVKKYKQYESIKIDRVKSYNDLIGRCKECEK